jgi:hypothetical protein
MSHPARDVPVEEGRRVMGTLSPVVCTPQQQWQPASVGRVRVSGTPAPVAASSVPVSSVLATGSDPRPLYGSQQIDALDHPRPRTSAAVT